MKPELLLCAVLVGISLTGATWTLWQLPRLHERFVSHHDQTFEEKWHRIQAFGSMQ